MEFYPLNFNANYNTGIFKTLSWIPICSVGRKYFDEEKCIDIANSDIRNKKEKIDNLLKAMQIFIYENFISGDDNIYINKNGRCYEYHKDAKIVDREGSCCGCASAATWLYEIIKEKYEDVSFLWMINQVGKGHIVNIFKYEGKIFLIDPFAFTSRYRKSLPYENGFQTELKKNRIITGIFMNMNTLDDFIEYHSKMNRIKGNMYSYAILKTSKVPPMFAERKTEGVNIYLPKEAQYSFEEICGKSQIKFFFE